MKIKDSLNKIICGYLIGLSIIIPGLNAPSIMIFLGMYDDIINNVSSIIKDFKRSIKYLFFIVLGIVFGIILGVFFLKQVYALYPFYVICFFGGMMIGAFPNVFKKIKNEKLTLNNLLFLLLGFIIPIVIILLSNNIFSISIFYINNNYSNIFYIFLGTLLSLTQLIPGLSATVVLLLFDCYQFLLYNLSFELIYNFDILIIYLYLFIGFLIGTIIFSKIIASFMKNKRILFNYLINGLVLSSIICIFSSKDCMLMYNKLNVNIVIISLLLMITGFIITYVIIYRKIVLKKNLGVNV